MSCPTEGTTCGLEDSLLLGRQVETLHPGHFQFETHTLLLMQLVVTRWLHGFAPEHIPLLSAGDAHPCSLKCAPHGVVGNAVVAHPDMQVPAGGKALALREHVLREVDAHSSW